MIWSRSFSPPSCWSCLWETQVSKRAVVTWHSTLLNLPAVLQNHQSFVYLHISLFTSEPKIKTKARPQSRDWGHSHNGDLQLEAKVITWYVFRWLSPGWWVTDELLRIIGKMSMDTDPRSVISNLESLSEKDFEKLPTI